MFLPVLFFFADCQTATLGKCVHLAGRRDSDGFCGLSLSRLERVKGCTSFPGGNAPWAGCVRFLSHCRHAERRSATHRNAQADRTGLCLPVPFGRGALSHGQAGKRGLLQNAAERFPARKGIASTRGRAARGGQCGCNADVKRHGQGCFRALSCVGRERVRNLVHRNCPDLDPPKGGHDRTRV